MRTSILTTVILLVTAAGQVWTQQCEWPDNEYVVQSIRLSGIQPLPASESTEILQLIQGKGFDNAEEFSMVIREALQRHGFFKAKVESAAFDKVESRLCNRQVNVSAATDLGYRYRLVDLTFTHAKAFSGTQLRQLMPIASGDVFDIEKIREGLKNLRNLYGEHGYINFTPIPDTQLDDGHGTIRLNIDVDEGGQFTVDQVIILAPQNVAEKLYQHWPFKPGAVYCASALESFFGEVKDFFPPDFDLLRDVEVKQNNESKTISIRLSLCPEGQVCPQQSRRFVQP